MSDVYTIIKRLEKGKQVESNLAMFANSMMTNASRLSHIRFTLNFSVFYERVQEELEKKTDFPEAVTDIVNRVVTLANGLVELPFSGDGMERDVAEADELRNTIIQQMKYLTALSDRFTIYEYVMNRMEYRFREDKLPEGYQDEDMKEQLMQYLLADRDRTVMQLKTVQVVEQLPMRMAKGRFFQILEDGLSVYKGSEKKTVEEVLYMIRTCSMMEEPEGMKEAYPALYQEVSGVFGGDWDEMDRNTFQERLEHMKSGFENLNLFTDLMLISQELVNDLYVIFLSRPYAMADLSEKESCEAIIKEICQDFKASAGPLPADLFAKFEQLEGVQERCYEGFAAGDAKLLDIQERYHDLLDGLMLDKIYASLALISKLLSNSMFIELNEKEETGEDGIADDAYVEQVTHTLAEELRGHLKQVPKGVGRAIMAKVLTALPLFVTNYQEVESYIKSSLESCTDEAEKAACVEILTQMIRDEA